MSEIEAFDTARAEAAQLTRGRDRKNVMEAQRWAMIDSLYHAALTKGLAPPIGASGSELRGVN
jgi:hypothetical protein